MWSKERFSNISTTMCSIRSRPLFSATATERLVHSMLLIALELHTSAVRNPSWFPHSRIIAGDLEAAFDAFSSVLHQGIPARHARYGEPELQDFQGEKPPASSDPGNDAQAVITRDHMDGDKKAAEQGASVQLELSDRFATKNPHPVLTFKKRIIHQDRVFIVERCLPVVPPKTPAADKSRAAYACSGGSVSFAMFNQLTLRLKARFSTLLDRVEDPVEILDYSYTRQVEQLYVLRRDVADLVTAKKRVAQQRDRRQEQFLKLDAGARRALELGREDLARRALERKQLVGQDSWGWVRWSAIWSASRLR